MNLWKKTHYFAYSDVDSPDDITLDDLHRSQSSLRRILADIGPAPAKGVDGKKVRIYRATVEMTECIEINRSGKAVR